LNFEADLRSNPSKLTFEGSLGKYVNSETDLQGRFSNLKTEAHDRSLYSKPVLDFVDRKSYETMPSDDAIRRNARSEEIKLKGKSQDPKCQNCRSSSRYGQPCMVWHGVGSTTLKCAKCVAAGRPCSLDPNRAKAKREKMRKPLKGRNKLDDESSEDDGSNSTTRLSDFDELDRTFEDQRETVVKTEDSNEGNEDNEEDERDEPQPLPARTQIQKRQTQHDHADEPKPKIPKLGLLAQLKIARTHINDSSKLDGIVSEIKQLREEITEDMKRHNKRIRRIEDRIEQRLENITKATEQMQGFVDELRDMI